MQPCWEHGVPVSWLHCVIDPLHEVVCHMQLACWQEVWSPCEVQAVAVPPQVPPRPLSPGVHVHPRFMHTIWLFVVGLVQVEHVAEQVPVATHPWQ
jgi:hypothetical protein